VEIAKSQTHLTHSVKMLAHLRTLETLPNYFCRNFRGIAF